MFKQDINLWYLRIIQEDIKYIIFNNSRLKTEINQNLISKITNYTTLRQFSKQFKIQPWRSWREIFPLSHEADLPTNQILAVSWSESQFGHSSEGRNETLKSGNWILERNETLKSGNWILERNETLKSGDWILERNETFKSGNWILERNEAGL